MIKQELWHEIHSRFKLKESKKSIARSLGVSVQTVRKILSQSNPKAYRRKKANSNLLSTYHEYIRQRLPAVGYCAQSIYEEIQQRGYKGGYDTVKLYVRPLRKHAHTKATVRFETPPAKQGQVDWGQCWTMLGHKRIKIHIFVMTLGYSRRLFALADFDEKLPTFINCHEKAFDHFGGLPHELIYDNTKTVVLDRDYAGRKIKWNATFWDFCTYYGFRAWAHRPYRAQTKGKVESGVKYVKRFLRGKRFESLAHLNQIIEQWLVQVADQRIHGTTHRKPIDMFQHEKDLLIDHRGKPAFVVQQRVVRHVARDCMVSFEANRYSVPVRFVGKQVDVQCTNERVLIFYQNKLIVSHQRCKGKYQTQIDKEHYQGIFYREDLPSLRLLQFDRTGSDQDEVQVRDLRFYEDLLKGGAL